jgi:hypothetical protein
MEETISMNDTINAAAGASAAQTICEYCGNPLTPPIYEGQRYCSRSHKQLSYQQRRRARDRRDRVLREESNAVEQQQQQAEPVLEAPEAVSFVRSYDRGPSKTTLGMQTIEVIVRNQDGEESSRVRDLDGRELDFINQELPERRINGVNANRMLRLIWGFSGCSLPLGADCPHAQHLEQRRHFTQLAQFFGLL